MDQLSLNQNVDSLFKSLENFTQNEGIIGKPVTQGDKTFLPVVSIAVGYGGGNANMKGQQNTAGMSSNTGTGALGLGAKLCTDAIIMIDNKNNGSVSVLPMNASNAGGIMDKIPQIISGMKGQGQGQSQQGQSQGTNQSQSQSTQSQQMPSFGK
jgi:uncharacterized spore protein YtfJ